MISLIIPLRASDTVFEALPRLEHLLNNTPATHYEVVVVDYGSPAEYSTDIERICRRYPHAKLVRENNEEIPFSAGNARNIGAQHARHPVIMFNDIDCLCSSEMYVRIAEEAKTRNISENFYEFMAIPVAFLSYEGVEEYNAIQNKYGGNIGDAKFFHNVIRSNKNAVLFLAYSGSTIVVNKYHYLSLGGSNQEFHGHGAEDFEIKHRLAAYNPIAKRPLDYYHNTKSNQISDYIGFRAYFSLYGLETLYFGIYMVHLWHPKREVKLETSDAPQISYNQTSRNFSLLKSLMHKFDTEGYQPTPLENLNSDEKILVLCRPNSVALENLRQVLPVMGRFQVIDENVFSGPSELEACIKNNAFTGILFLNPYGNEHRLTLYRYIRLSGIKYWTFDRGSLPDSWFFDPNGFNADSDTYSSKNWNVDLSESEINETRHYISSLRNTGKTLEKNGSPKSSSYWRGRFGVGHRKVLFIPLQRPSDTVAKYFSGNIGAYENFYLWISSIASRLDSSEWIVIAKKHPLETIKPVIPGVIFAPDDAHVHDMIDLADVVVTMNSGVGVLALAFGKPVICCGNSFYAGDGLAHSAHSVDEVLEIIKWTNIDTEKVYKFVHYLIRKVYSFGAAEYLYKTQEDGSLFASAKAIKFTSIRGFGREVKLGTPRSMTPLSGFVFNSFGGEQAFERARMSQTHQKQKNVVAEHKSKPSLPSAASLMSDASAEFYRRNYAKSACLFREASKLEPTHVNLLRYEAEALYLDGYKEKAITRLRAASSLRPRNKSIRKRILGMKYPWIGYIVRAKSFLPPQ